MTAGPVIRPAAENARLHRAGSAWTDLGTQCVASRAPGAREYAVQCHKRAVALLAALPIAEDHGYLADLGAAWVNLGCALQAGTTPESPVEALDAFDRGLDLLGKLPLGASPRFRHNLAAAWMNRADAFAQVGTDSGNGEALQAYGRAIGIAGELPLDEKPSFRILLASCCINQGSLCQRLQRLPEAVRAYDGAVAALGNLPGAGHRLACHHAATAWTNRAEALLASNTVEDALSALDSSRRALAQVEGRDLDGPVDAKLSLRALRAMARARECLVRAGASGGTEAIAALTDVAERGLDLAFGGHEGDPAFFDPFIVWFFSFGSRVYGRHQPQFLKEYLDEALGRWDYRGSAAVGAALLEISRQAAAGAMEVLGRRRLLVAGTPQTERLIGAARELRGAAFRFNP